MVIFLPKFVKLLVFSVALTGCGFQLAQKTKLSGDAQSLRIANIENTSHSAHVDFLLEQELQKKFSTYNFYTDNIAELELFITITSSNFSALLKEQQTKDFYRHSYSVKAKLLVEDLRNESPSKQSKNFSVTKFLAWRDGLIDTAMKRDLQHSTIAELAEQIFSFVVE